MARRIKYISGILIALSVTLFPAAAFGANTTMKITYDGKTYNYSAEEVSITINGTKITDYNMPPIILDSRTLVPARAVFEAMGAEVAWNADTKEVYIIKGNDVVVIQINNNYGTKNGEQFIMDVAPKIINDSTMIPVRAVSEALNCTVDWDAAARNVIISEKQESGSSNTGNTTGENTGTDVPSGNIISLRSVSVPESSSSAQTFTIHASGAIEKYDVIEVGGDRIAIDVYGAQINMAGSSRTVSTSPYVKSIRWAQNQTTPTYIARVVFDVTAMADYDVSLSADKKAILLSYSENTITDITTSSQKGADHIIIKGDAAPEAKISYLSNPDRVVIDIPYAISELDGSYSASGLSFVNSIRTSQFDKSTVRIVLETEKGVEADVSVSGNKADISISKSTVENISYTSDDVLVLAKGAMSIKASDIKKTNNYANNEYKLTLPGDYEGVYGYGRLRIGGEYTSGIYLSNVGGNTVITIDQNKIFEVNIWEDSSNVYVELKDPRDVYDFVVVIDAGHGLNDPGTNGNGIVEKDLNLDVLLKLKSLLDGNSNIKAYYTRTSDTYPENMYRAFMGNSAADLFVSIHHNSSVSSAPNGTETLYAVHSNDTGSGLTSVKAAKCLHKYITEALGTTDRGIKERPDLIVLNQTTVPAVLVEAAFLSNEDDAEKMASELYRFKEAEAIYNAICELAEAYGD